MDECVLLVLEGKCRFGEPPLSDVDHFGMRGMRESRRDEECSLSYGVRAKSPGFASTGTRIQRSCVEEKRFSGDTGFQGLSEREVLHAVSCRQSIKIPGSPGNKSVTGKAGSVAEELEHPRDLITSLRASCLSVFFLAVIRIGI